MDIDRKYIIYGVIGLIVVSLLGYSGYTLYTHSKFNKDQKVISNGDGSHNTVQENKPVYSSLDEALKHEFGNIKYDLQSIVYSSVKPEEISMFIPQGFVPEFTQEQIEKMKEKLKSQQNTSGKQVEFKLPEDTKEIKSYLEITKTAKKDYKDFLASFYPDKGFILIIYKPADGKELTLEQSIKSGMSAIIESMKDENLKKIYSSYIWEEHNGYNILIACKNAKEIKTNILVNMGRVDGLIKEAVEQQYKN